MEATEPPDHKAKPILCDHEWRRTAVLQDHENQEPPKVREVPEVSAAKRGVKDGDCMPIRQGHAAEAVPNRPHKGCTTRP